MVSGRFQQRSREVLMQRIRCEEQTDAHLSQDKEPSRGPAPLGHTRLESTVQYLGIELDDALQMSEQTEV
jgi:hypothetical protein